MDMPNNFAKAANFIRFAAAQDAATLVAVPLVDPITRLGSCAEGISVVDVDMGILEEAERK